MESQEILYLLRQKEGIKLEFKRELHKINHSDKQVKDRHWNELIKDIISLTNGNINTAGQTGYLIFGAEDELKSDRTRDLYDVGSIELAPKLILQKINSVCYPHLTNIDCESVEVDGKRLFVISIESSPHLHEIIRDLTTPNQKTYPPGTVFVRRNEEICTATSEEREAIKREKLNFIDSSDSPNQLIREGYENISRTTQTVNDILNDFVGSKHIFTLIDNFIEANSKGYLVIEGEPGTGKTTILAGYVRQKGCLVYFNGLQGSRVEQFLKNICTQLIARYGLKHSSLPDDATRDGAFLIRLLQEVSTLGEKIIIAIDALDEVEFGDNAKANILHLPRLLPESIYFILTQTPNILTLRLSNTPEEKLNLRDYSDERSQDIEEYIRHATQHPKLHTWLNTQEQQLEEFIALLAQKSENNFRYLYHVLEDIKRGRYQDLDSIERLPKGLTAYYERYWQQMGMNSEPVPFTEFKIMRILVDVRQPVSCSLIAKWAEETQSTVKKVIKKWKYFLREHPLDDKSLYAFYHKSFCNFLRQTIEEEEGIIVTGINALFWNNFTSLSPEEKSYILEHLLSHLVDDDKIEQICTVLADFSFIEAKIVKLGWQPLLGDYDLVFNSNLQLLEEQADSLRLLQGAIRLSVRALSQQNDQLVGQLLGRLLFCDKPLVQRMLEQAEEKQSACCWLRPLTSSLTPPGESLMYTLEGHNSSGRIVTLFSKGQRAVSASDNGELKVWDLISGRNLHTLTGHSDSVNAIAITPREQQVISASEDGNLKVWELNNGISLHTLTGHNDWVRAIAIAPDGQRVVSASDDTTLIVWDLNSGENLCTLEGHGAEVKAVAITDDGQWVISASDDNTLKVWNLENGNLRYTLQGHTDPIMSLGLVPHQNQIISASQDKTLRVWDLANGMCLQILEGHNDWVRTVAVTPDGQQVISASDDQTLRVWDLNSGKSEPIEQCHEKWINCVAIAPNGKQVITASDDKTLKIWDLETKQASKSLEGHTDAVNDIAITSDGQRGVSVSEDGTLKVWDLASDRAFFASTKHRDQVRAVAISRNGQWAVSASDDKTLKVWSLPDDTNPHTLEHDSRVRTVTITPDSQQIVSASGDGTLTVWSLVTGAKLKELTGHHTNQVNAVAITPDGQRAVSASDDEKNNLMVWSLDKGEIFQNLGHKTSQKLGHTGPVNAVALSPDGQRAVSASDDNNLKVWDLASGNNSQTLVGHTNRVRAVTITPDGQRAVSASDDSTLKVWDLASGTTLQTLEGHTDRVRSVAVTTDGHGVVSASYDNTLKVWDLRSGETLHTFKGHSKLVNDVVLTRNKYAISISDDCTLQIWDLLSGRVIAVFTGDSELLTCDVAPNGVTIVAGEKSGRVHFLRLQQKQQQLRKQEGE